MKLEIKKRSVPLTKGDTLVMFFTEKEMEDASRLTGEREELEGIDLRYFKAKTAETLFIPIAGRPNLVLCGLGKEESIDGETFRNASAAVTSLCRERGIREIIVAVPEKSGMAERDVISHTAEGLALSNYAFSRYKSNGNGEIKPLLDRISFITGENMAPLLKEIGIIAENTHLCRDLVNEISEESNALGIAREAGKIARSAGIDLKVYKKKDIEKMKMGLLLAVNRGSKVPAQLLVLKYRGNPQSSSWFALVGKGITFDSGGMNLKPSGHLETMRMDMSGAAIALYTIKAAAELKLRKNIYAVMPLTENMLSNDSYRPGDVFTAYNGKTVEIGNTDAEGRLILADALSFTEDKLKPSVIVDIATLTGACIVAFGETVAGYLSTDDALAAHMEEASKKTGDKIWRLPLYGEYDECLKSDMADLNNISSEKNAGTIIGAVFLKNFIKNTRWAHIDIAGTAWYSKPRGYRPKNATGFGVRLMVEAIRTWQE